VIKNVRVDSNPCQNSTHSLAELLSKYRINTGLSKGALAAKLGVSIGTLKNWEMGRTKPNRRFWQELRIIKYLAYDPFKKLANTAKGNESQ
jgi:DNA-binding transcriptional regulator YiaG